MKVFVSGDEVHTGQVFFRAVRQAQGHAQGVYAERGQADLPNASDSIYREAGARALVALKRKGRLVPRRIQRLAGDRRGPVMSR